LPQPNLSCGCGCISPRLCVIAVQSSTELALKSPLTGKSLPWSHLQQSINWLQWPWAVACSLPLYAEGNAIAAFPRKRCLLCTCLRASRSGKI
jgi:hypothetical protein